MTQFFIGADIPSFRSFFFPLTGCFDGGRCTPHILSPGNLSHCPNLGDHRWTRLPTSIAPTAPSPQSGRNPSTRLSTHEVPHCGGSFTEKFREEFRGTQRRQMDCRLRPRSTFATTDFWGQTYPKEGHPVPSMTWSHRNVFWILVPSRNFLSCCNVEPCIGILYHYLQRSEVCSWLLMFRAYW